jgi:hypothetical protein
MPALIEEILADLRPQTPPDEEGAKSDAEHFFDAEAPFHWSKADVLRIMEQYRLKAVEDSLKRHLTFEGSIAMEEPQTKTPQTTKGLRRTALPQELSRID